MPQAVPDLRERLRQDDNADVRQAAVEALGSIGDAEAVPDLRQRLRQDDNADVRQAAAHAIGNIGGAEAVPDFESVFVRRRIRASVEPSPGHWCA